MTGSGRLLLIIGPPPTPNGSLHIGHIAGPYMSADVMRRWYHLLGRKALFVTGTDDSQTYVVSSARKLGQEPGHLASRSTVEIQRSLEASLIDVDGFAPYDTGYEQTVREFLDPLRAAGKFKLVARELPFDRKSGQFLVEGLVTGECPNCLARSRGALCEACGLPLLCEELRGAASTLDAGADIERRRVEILVFPLETVRRQLEDYYTESRLAELRPASARIIRRILSKPLPEFPITYPLNWGIGADYPEVPGQVFNAWAEGMAASMYCTAAVGNGSADEGIKAWTSKDTDLVYFLGLDNVYFWGMSHLGLLLAHEGRFMVPRSFYSNHFYELNDEKISTSRGHVLLMEDLLRVYSPEVVRFYLCWTSPETCERSFSAEAMETVAAQQLVNPWNLVWDFVRDLGQRDVGCPASNAGVLSDLELMRVEMDHCLSMASFSVSAAARAVAKHLDRLASYVRSGDVAPATVRLQFIELARLADPILKLEASVAEVQRPDWHPRRLSLMNDVSTGASRGPSEPAIVGRA